MSSPNIDKAQSVDLDYYLVFVLQYRQELFLAARMQLNRKESETM